MSEAFSDHYPAAASEAISDSLAAFYQELPGEILSSNVRNLANDRASGNRLKKRLLLATAVGVHAKRLPNFDLRLLPNETMLDETLVFAEYLLLKARTDTEVEACLELLDEAVAPFRELSPLPEVERIEKLVPHHTHLTAGVVLATKLWTFEHMGDPDDMPTSFFESKRKHVPIMKASMGVRGFTNKFAVF